MTLVKDIQTENWSLSITKQGDIVTDFSELNQTIYIILMTRPGSDPLRPDFGCAIFNYLDSPVNTAIPMMAKSIADALARWETRIKPNPRIKISLDESRVFVEIEWDADFGQFKSRVVFFNEKNPFDTTTKQEYSDEYSDEYA